MKIRPHALLIATVLVASPVAVSAQTPANTVSDSTYAPEERDDFPWGLLGILGLAGLLGMKRRDDDRVNRTGATDRR